MDIPYEVELKIDEIDPQITEGIPINYAKHNEIIPILETDYTVTLALSDPFNSDAINDIQEHFKKEIKLTVYPPLKIQDAINRIYEKANQNLVDSLEDEYDESLDLDGPIDILDAGADEAPVIRFVNSIIFRAVKENASDIHIEPYEKESIYRFRINGVMTEILRQPRKTHPSVSSRIKVLANLDIAEKRLPQDGRIKIKMAGKDVDIRLSTVPVQKRRTGGYEGAPKIPPPHPNWKNWATTEPSSPSWTNSPGANTGWFTFAGPPAPGKPPPSLPCLGALTPRIK